MNKVSSDKLFAIILVAVFAVGIGLLTALRYADVGEGHAAGGHGGEKPTEVAAHAPAEH